MKKLFLLAILIVLLVDIDHIDASTAIMNKKHYCNKAEIRIAMVHVCGLSREGQKRSGLLYPESDENRKNRIMLWRRVFNITPNSTRKFDRD